MDRHLTAWRINRALAWLYGLLMIGLGVYVHYHPHVLQPRHVLIAFATLPVLVVVHGLVASGARLRQTWARFVSMALGCLLLPALPIGTIFGAFLIWACAHPWGDPRAHSGAARGRWHQDGRRR